MLGFSCVAPIRTVHELLDEYDVLDLLRDPLITTATQEIIAEKKSRREIQREIRAKERAIETLSAKYRREPKLTQEMVRQALYSIGDNHAFLRTNRDPCDRMIGYLQQYFHPTQVRDKKNADSLAIRSGRGGSRLSHDHARQYVYVMQSLALWREILHGTPALKCPFSKTFTDLPFSTRHVPPVVACRARFALRDHLVSSARHRPRLESRASGAEDISHDACHSQPRAEESRGLGRVICHSHGRPQRAQCAHVHRYVLT